jgi:hypothetical protein
MPKKGDKRDKRSKRDKRDKERLPTHGQLDGEVMVFQPLTIIDISNDGALVETPFGVQLDSLHEFRLTLGARSVIVKARIAHSRLHELRNGVAYYRSGVEFIEPSDHVRDAITAFVQELRESTHLVIEGEVAGGQE